MDPRFLSPGATLATYWEALRSNDTSLAEQCFVDPYRAVPHPGMLWFLPPARRLGVYSLELMPVESGRVLATYEVRFRPLATGEDLKVVAGTELIRVRGAWLILRLSGEGGLPEWRPIPHPVDT